MSAAPFFSEAAASPPPNAEATPAPRPHRIRPWRKFISALVPNWLLRRTEVSQGAKLAYARLAQYEGRDGECYPKQTTLAAELGICERTAHRYVRELIRFKLIESDRPGLGASNSYYFLDHPWMREGQPEALASAGQDQQDSSAPDQTDSSRLERQEMPAPTIEENQVEKNQEKRKKTHTQGGHADGLPHSLQEAVEVAHQLGIEEAFARLEFHAKRSVDWKDGYGNPITSWPDHLQARWLVEQRKRTERRGTGRTSASRRTPQPPRQFHSTDYQQSVKDF